MKAISSSATCQLFCLLKRGLTDHDIASKYPELCHAQEMEITPLDETSSPNDGTRSKYLRVNILQRYYANRPDIYSSYFASGANFLAETTPHISAPTSIEITDDVTLE